MNKPRLNSHYEQGYFILKNKEKYVGDSSRIIFRSSLERKFCEFCDETPSVLKWNSEALAIRYLNPVFNRLKTYYPDYMMVKDVNGKPKMFLIEVKPKSQLSPPKKPIREDKKAITNYNRKLGEFLVVKAKRDAALKWCTEKDATYLFVTEDFFK